MYNISILLSIQYKYKMAKLQKGLEDYFRIPILLKPIGQTPLTSIKKLHSFLSAYPKILFLDERYQPLQTLHSKLLLKRPNHSPQSLYFKTNDFTNEWPQFQVIYRSRFCVGVFDSQDNLFQQWKKACKVCSQENRKMVGLIILTIQNCNLEGIKQPSIIIPPKLSPEQFSDFLQPWFLAILPQIQDHFCYLISELQKDDNGFIVFNKAEQKPEPRTLKRKKKGRCLKICGDFCLNLHLIKQAFAFYTQAQELLRKVDDYLWVLGCNQGKLACFTTEVQYQGINKQQTLQNTRNQCLILGRKIKVSQLQTENYFKILKIYTKISQKFEQMSTDFLNYVLANYSISEKFSILTQLAFLFKQAGMIRKHNYMLYICSRIAMQLKPSLVQILLNEIIKSGHVKQWAILNANVIKLMIQNSTDSKNGELYLNLLQNCCSVLTERDVEVTVESLQRRNFSEIKLQNTDLIEVVSITCIQSDIKPKNNMISQESPVKSGPGFFMNWRRKQIIYKFQQEEDAKFQIKIRNNMNFPIRILVKLNFSPSSKTSFHSVYLEPKLNKIILTERFHNISELTNFNQIEIKFFNFILVKPSALFSSLKLEIYQEYPDFQIEVPDTYRNQQSSLFQLPLILTRSKPYLKLSKVTLTISVYYTLEIGFQQTFFEIVNLDQKKYLVVLSDYPYDNSNDQTVTLIKLAPLKTEKKFLKKIQFKIDAIRQQNSKYQISKKQTSLCAFQSSIWCELISITTPTEQRFNRKDSNIIQDQFVVKISINKKKNDLTPYKVTQSQKIYVLSESTTVIIQKILNRKKKTLQNNDQPLIIKFEWCNSIRIKECGNIIFQVPASQKMFLSQKSIKFDVNVWNKKQKQVLNSPAQLKIDYKLQSQTNNLSHSLVIQPLNLLNIKKYVVSGKNKIKIGRQAHQQKKIIQNNVRIKFFYEFYEEYMVGLKFQDGQAYWFPCAFCIIQ